MVDLWTEITTICLFPWKEAWSKLLSCHQWNPKLICMLNFVAALVWMIWLVSMWQLGWFLDNVRKRMNHLLFSSRATADTAVNTLSMSIIFNVTPLWKVLTENHTESRSSPAGEHGDKEEKSIPEYRFSSSWTADRGRSLTAIVCCPLTGR